MARVNPEVLVVGAGPVGLFSALILARRGVRVQIVDKDWRTGAHSYALALHSSSFRLLDSVGLLPAVLERAYRVETIGLYDESDRRAEVCLGGQTDVPGFVAVLPQDALEQLLEAALKKLGVSVLWNHELSRLVADADRAVATVDKLEKDSVGYSAAHTEWTVAKTFEWDVRYVIAADGHRSRVRRSLGIAYPEVGQSQQYAVFEFKTDTELPSEMRLMLGERTTDVVWPLPGGYCRWSFQIDGAAPEAERTKDRVAVQFGRTQFPLLNEERLKQLLAERAPWFKGSVDEIVWRLVVRFERRLADSFGSGRVWLAGDAAHMTAPAGMQSMNVGLDEANRLAGVIAGILRGGESPAGLEAYGQDSLRRWRQLLSLDGGVKPTAQADPWIRQRADRIPACLPASGERLATLLSQLGLETAQDSQI